MLELAVTRAYWLFRLLPVVNEAVPGLNSFSVLLSAKIPFGLFMPSICSKVRRLPGTEVANESFGMPVELNRVCCFTDFSFALKIPVYVFV